MGLLDQVVSGALGGMGNYGANQTAAGGNSALAAVLLPQLIAMLSKPGALSNLTAAAQQFGLGNLLQSWIGTGANLPVSGAHVQQILGAGAVEAMAAKAGVGVPEVSNELAKLLPQVIDKVSPGGKAPS
jgi:uncharacterized protein YidB (DUF937 family)